jgi:hypothetical protein
VYQIRPQLLPSTYVPAHYLWIKMPFITVFYDTNSHCNETEVLVQKLPRPQAGWCLQNYPMCDDCLEWQCLVFHTSTHILATYIRSAEQAGHNGNFKFWQYTWHIVDILQNNYSFMRSEAPTLVIVRITIFGHMTSCHLLEIDKRFEGNNCLQFQSRICRQQFSPKCW